MDTTVSKQMTRTQIPETLPPISLHEAMKKLFRDAASTHLPKRNVRTPARVNKKIAK